MASRTKQVKKLDWKMPYAIDEQAFYLNDVGFMARTTSVCEPPKLAEPGIDYHIFGLYLTYTV